MVEENIDNWKVQTVYFVCTMFVFQLNFKIMYNFKSVFNVSTLSISVTTKTLNQNKKDQILHKSQI